MADHRYRPVPIYWPPTFLYPTDPLTQRLYAEQPRTIETRDGDVMLSAMGNQVIRQPNAEGMTEIAVIFTEINPLPDEEYRKLREFRAVITGSSWNQHTLSNHGLPCRCVLQGVDTDLFRPQPKRRLRDRFVVFSGGQLTYRKGQDLIVKAFSYFAEKHPDALLVASWRAPWEGREVTSMINGSRICAPFVYSEDMHASIVNWVMANGIPPEQFIELGAVANRLMPDIFREVDLALFTNRCEGGTNLVAMEALSSGVLCGISHNTGHLDIIRSDNCIPLLRQQPIPTNGFNRMVRMDDWGESDLEEILSVMENAYDGKLALDRGTIRASMQEHSWEQAINRLLNQVQDIQISTNAWTNS